MNKFLRFELKRALSSKLLLAILLRVSEKSLCQNLKVIFFLDDPAIFKLFGDNYITDIFSRGIYIIAGICKGDKLDACFVRH